MVGPSDSVLITGSSGLTGRKLAAALLALGVRVFGLSKDPVEKWEFKSDLANEESIIKIVDLIKPDVVVHLAGITSSIHPSPTEIYDVNISGTVRLLSELVRASHNPRLIVLASSAMVYAPPFDNKPLDESSQLEPLSHYGVSKLAMEKAANLFMDQLPIQIVRPFNYTGPGQSEKFFVPKVVQHFANGLTEISVGNLDVYRDISSVDDVVSAYIRIISGERNSPVINICSGHATLLSDVIDLMVEISGRDIKVNINPRFVRDNEPRYFVGCRTLLDNIIGNWERRPLRDILAEMYFDALND